jgi:hypothetical protein
MPLDSVTTHFHMSREFTVRVTEDAGGFLVSVVFPGIAGQKDIHRYRNQPLAAAAGVTLARGLINAARLI